MNKPILLLFLFCLITVPNKASSEIAVERNLFWFFDGILFSTCTYYKQGYLPEKIAKRDFKFWYSRIEEDLKTEEIKERLIARHYKDVKCRNLMP